LSGISELCLVTFAWLRPRLSGCNWRRCSLTGMTIRVVTILFMACRHHLACILRSLRFSILGNGGGFLRLTHPSVGPGLLPLVLLPLPISPPGIGSEEFRHVLFFVRCCCFLAGLVSKIIHGSVRVADGSLILGDGPLASPPCSFELNNRPEVGLSVVGRRIMAMAW